MTYLILTAFFASVEMMYDRFLQALKKYGLKNKDAHVSQEAHKLMHARQMPTRAVYFITISFAIASEMDGLYAWDDIGIFFHTFLLLATNIAFFWWFFDIMINKQVLMVDIQKMGGGWETKYFGWMGDWGYFAFKTLLFGTLLGLSIYYNI